ncbi:hypothetical protein BU17DRAFT_84489 [Hysterangium stoloniferum]|nr:hypothetical protein BU17DRAFT_84489 [Hysterangium stoloniferum]
MPIQEETRVEGDHEKVDGRENPSMEPTPGPKQICKQNRDLHIQGIPTLNPPTSSSLIGTPFGSLQGSPFEYPFPSPNKTITPPYPYHTSLPMAASFPFPVTPSLTQRSHSYPFSTGKFNSMTPLGFPIRGINTNSTNVRFVPTAPPPVPPRLRKQKDVQGASSAESIDNDSVPRVVVTSEEQLSDTGAQSGGEAPDDQTT